MSRLFDGVDDFVTLAPGALATAQNGAWTLAYAVRINDNHRGGIYDASQSGTRRFGINPFDDNVFVNVAGVATVSASYVAFIDEWVLLILTKAAGSAQVRTHVYVFDTDTWSHTDIGLIGGNGSGTADQIKIGKFDDGQFSPMNLAAFAGWTGIALSDGQCETMPAGTQAWGDLAPSSMLDFTSTDPGDTITDLMLSGTNQTAIVGTTDAPGEDPPGFAFDYAAGPPDDPHVGTCEVKIYLRPSGHGVRPSLGTVELGFRLTLAPVGSGTSPSITRRPARLTARGRSSAMIARGGYVNA